MGEKKWRRNDQRSSRLIELPATIDLPGKDQRKCKRTAQEALRIAVEHARLIDDSTGVVGLIAWICAEATSTEHPDSELLRDPRKRVTA